MNKIFKYINNNKGSGVVFITLSMTIILATAALAIDVGLIFIERSRAINAVDSAVLAGAQELPTKPNKAISEAEKIGKLNGLKLEKMQINISENNTKIEIKEYVDVELIFARFIGIDTITIPVTSVAIVGPATGIYGGARPLVVEKQTLVYGQQVTLKENAGDGYSGNYGAVALGGKGSKVLEKNLMYGYDGQLKIGDIIYTETGNIAGPVYDGVSYVTSTDSTTFENLDRKSSRIWIMPVVDSLQVSGNKPVTIVGFASFFVESAQRKSGQTEIYGRFIEFATNADIDFSEEDYGLKGIKLIQ